MPHAMIFDAVRTPRGKGKKDGSLHEVKPIDLLAGLLVKLQKRHGFDPAALDDVVMGVVSPVGEQGSVIAKTAALKAGWDFKVAGMQINRFCASGLEAVNIAAQKVASGWEDLVVAGGVESMSRVPIGSDGGAWSQDPATNFQIGFVPQGIGADLIATLAGWDREDVDRFALTSQQRAAAAQSAGHFDRSVLAVDDEIGLPVLERDEFIKPRTTLEGLGQLKIAFAELGAMGFDAVALARYPQVERIEHVHTAGNSSGIVDGAAAVLIGSEAMGRSLGLTPRARIVATALSGADPTIMLTGPMPATRKALAKAGLTIDDIDLFEVNEAFAAVPMRFMKELGVPHEKVNVNGGAIAMGHPLGATGAMLVGTLLDELERRNLKRGLVTLCVGGGMGIATIVVRCPGALGAARRAPRMNTLRYDLAADGILTITFDAPDAAVNTMTLTWQHDLAAAAAQAVADKERIRGILLASAKPTFFAGAALKSVLSLEAKDAAAGFAEIRALTASYRTLETLGRPVVSLLAGSALGGGWEVALIGHARFALDDPKIRFGMPEVTLGLIPGATGVTKTVRTLGLMAAQPYLLEGKLFGPREALEIGWVDGIAASVDELRAQALAWIDAHADAAQPWDRKDYRMPGGTPASPKIAAALAVAPAVLAQKTRGLYPATQAILEAMVEGALVDYDTAVRIEARKLAKVLVGQNAKNMIQAFFFDLQAIRSGKARPKGFPSWRPTKVGILGAGMMGAGIAHANASRGIVCILKDVSAEKAAAGIAAIRKVTAAQVKRGALDEIGEAKLLALVTPAAEARALDGCELIVEAVFENRALKAEVTREAEPMLAPDGVFASNTSTLPISGLAAASAQPERFVGLHFFSPVHKMKLVEIIRGKQTSDETLARAYDYVIALGKTPIVVNDSRGFFTSRVFGTYVMEGAAMLAEGIAAPLIEHAALAAGMPVGPLAVLDETSLALSVHVLEQTRADWQSEGRSYVPSAGEALVEKMVKELGRPGRAGGGGFYDYPSGAAKRLWPGLATHFAKPGVDADLDSLKQRLLYRQSIETARCLAEGVLTSTAEANIGSIFGIGFPAWTGGAIQFVASEGKERFLVDAAALAKRHGDRFAISEATLNAALAPHVSS